MQSRMLIDEFIAQKTIALAGVSRGGKKFGNIVHKSLSKKGYQMLAVHPDADELNSMVSYSSLSKLPAGVENLILVIPPEQTEEIVQQAPSAGIRRIWMQQGSESPKAIEFCQQNSIDLVHGECILMFAEPKGLHKFHRWIMELFGKIPK